MSKILIVDDDKHVIQQVSACLTSLEYEVQFTLEPEYLFQLLDAVPIDLILLDVYMPGTDGMTVLQKLKAHPTFQNLPVIMLTADTDERLLKKCFELGASDFVNKPVSAVVLNARIEATLTIRQTLEQKEILLKEIHHRVKNNLQIISSLFAMQTNYTEDQNILDILKDSQNRVDSMAMIHERLYSSDDLANIHFGRYIEDLATDIFHSYNVRSGAIALKFDLEDISISLDDAIPCALILNELISNTLKYAYPDDRSGELRIMMQYCDNQYTLAVSDDGVGLPAGLDIKKTKSLGLRLVRILTSQLKGTVDINSSQGTTVKICF